MAIVVTHTKVSAIPDGDDSSLIRPSDWNETHTLTGLGTMAEQNANAVVITGGTISGVTLPASNITGTLGVPNGGTGATTLTGYVKGSGTTALTASATIPNTDITGLGTASTKNAGSANGVATLDSGGKVPISELPAAVLGALSYQGTWNASTNTPTLTSSVGTKGYYYVVDVAGTTNLNGITDWLIGDWAVFNGSVWQKIDNTDAVTSVNGLTGTVVLTTTNIAEGTNEYFTTAKARTSVSAGTGISYNNTTGVITNASPSLGGDVVGPASATDNAIARFDTTTGKLLQNSVVTIDDTGAATGFTTLSASTSVSTPIVKATSSAGGALQNASGTNQVQWGAGGGDNFAINVSTNINGTNAQVDLSPTGTGHVHIKPTGVNSVEINPTSVGLMDNITIGATTPKNGSFVDLSVTGAVSFDALQGTAGQVLTSAGTGVTPTWTTPTTGTVTSVTGTAPVVSSGGNTPAISMAAANTTTNGYLTSTDWNTFNGKSNTNGTVTSVSATVPSFLSISGSPITTTGTLALTYSGTALPLANGGTGKTSAPAAMANLMGFTSTATAGGTTTLTNTSSYYQLFTGSTTQTIVLPVTSTLQTGWTFHICNNSTGILTVNSSGGNLVLAVPVGTTVMYTCIGTTLTTAADWEAGITDFSTVTGTGAVALNVAPSFVGITATGGIALTGSSASNVSLGTNQTTGTQTLGGASQTGILTVGQSTVSQTTNIQAGATASGSTKTMNIGTGGLTGSTTTMAIGSTFGTTVTCNGTWNHTGAITTTSTLTAGSGVTGGIAGGTF